MERKLSTIFASDVVGFSKMMVANGESIDSINAPSCTIVYKHLAAINSGARLRFAKLQLTPGSWL